MPDSGSRPASAEKNHTPGLCVRKPASKASLLIRLASIENIHNAEHVAKSEHLTNLNMPAAQRREDVDALIADAVKGGDEPSVVSEAIVAAATDPRPKLRYPAGALARRVSKLRRYAPSALFDKQIRKINQLAA